VASGEKRVGRFAGLKVKRFGGQNTHQEKQRDGGRRLQVRAESQQTAIAILHYELPTVPWHVAVPE
jgi:hypothetical protein